MNANCQTDQTLVRDNQPSAARPFVLDVSRLVWRQWTGRLPTGIDRVCLAYLDRYRNDALAMVQWGRLRLVLDGSASDALFSLLRRGGKHFRRRIIAQLAAGMAHRTRESLAGKIYLNVGHTGLDVASLPAWLRQQRLRPVFLIHDLIPITHPHFCRAGEAQRHARRMRHALQCAAGMIVNSRATRDDLAAFAAASQAPLPETAVAWLGVDQKSAAIPAPADLGRPYFLAVGTIEVRKNHLLLLGVWETLAREGPGSPPLLVLVGQRGWKANETFELLDHSAILKDHVRELSHCSDADLLGLIQGARALLMPSFAEGYGLPVFEALHQGLPVIAADLPAYREVAGTIPLYLDPVDRPAWIAAIQDFIGASPERSRQSTALRSYQAPDWESHFTRVDRLLADLQSKS